MASIRLTDNQEKYIKQTGLNRSEFVRRAVDYYMDYLRNPHNEMLLVELESWINLKKSTIVTQNNTSVTNMNTNVTHMSTDVTNMNTNNTDVTQNSRTESTKNPKITIKEKLLNDADLIRRMLIAPENAGVIPDKGLKILSKRYDISKNTIQAWINENKNLLLEGRFEEI